MNKKIAIVTGASNGIGKAVALDLSKKKYHVVLISRSIEKLNHVKSEIEQHGGEASMYAVDVSDYLKLQQCLNEIVTKFSRIDLLFNSAGILKMGTTNMEAKDVDELIKINLIGVIYAANLVAQQMKQQRSGYIINISSMAGKRALPSNGIYAASKFGLVGFGEALFRELASFNVKVTTICPSTVATDMTKHFGIGHEVMIKTPDIVKSVNYLLELAEETIIQELHLQCTAIVTRETEAYTTIFK